MFFSISRKQSQLLVHFTWVGRKIRVPNFFWTKDFFKPKSISGKKIFWHFFLPKFFFDQPFFSNQKYFLDQIIFQTIFFWLNIFWQTLFLVLNSLKQFLTTIFFDPNIFLTKFYLTKKTFGPTFFRTINFCSDLKFFWTNIFLDR